MNIRIQSIVAACALALAAGPAFATVDAYLAAKAYTKTLPDSTQVEMWGYVADPGGLCYDAADTAARLTCVNGLPDPVSPGPRLTAGIDDPNFRIFLSNGLSEPTSIVIPGQELPWSAADNGPTWNDGTTGSRGTNLTKKVRSYGREAVANGGRQPYRWTNFRNNPFANSGTFMYQSGTNPQLQVYMGLYGAVTKDFAVGEAYPGVTYDNEVTLFYSDIDLAHNAAVATGDSAYTPIDYNASWFLVNGEPYVAGTTLPIPAGGAGESTLVRFLSTASENHVPVFQGLHGMIHAEDGMQYTWQNGDVVGGTAPREQYSVGLPPLKTKDVIITPNADGLYAVYDGNGYMTNPSNPDDPADGGDTVGGMLRFLAVGVVTNTAPVAIDDVYAVDQDLTLVVPASGVLANDTDVDGDALTAVVDTVLPTNGTVTLNPDGSFTYTPDTGFTGIDTFTYLANDGTLDSNIGTVTITVNQVVTNTAPVASDDAYTTVMDVPLIVSAPGVLVNDSDVDGDPLTAVLDTGPTSGTLTLNPDGSFTYTPNTGFFGTDSFTYLANDGTVNSTFATVTITVNEVVTNTPPVAIDDAYATDQDVDLVVPALGVLANDTDADGDALTAVLDTVLPANGTLTLNPDGSFTYAPNAGFFGIDSFTYLANDGTVDSTFATVTITVNEAVVATQLNVTVDGVLESHDVLTYGGTQDVVSTTEILNGGDTLSIVGNGWKQVLLNAPYNVTTGTVLEVTFSSVAEGEIHAIGFDNDDAISSGTTFQLFGTQAWGIQSFNNYTTGTVTYTIPVGDSFVGTFDRIVFAMDHDVTTPTGESVFNNISVSTQPPPQLNVTVNGVPTALDVLTYGGAQDGASTTEILDAGNTLSIVGNGWKQVQFNCTVDASTNLDFSFSSGAQGEIHGIGFDTDDVISSGTTFQLYGTQAWGIQNFRTYADGDGTVTYSIPVGTFFTGAFSRLIFAMDHDVASPTGESVFNNIVVSGCL